MIECGYCHKQTSRAKGCAAFPIVCNGITYAQIKVGDHGDGQAGIRNAICPGCGAAYGNYHHAGCPREICPVCNRLLSTCGCAE